MFPDKLQAVVLTFALIFLNILLIIQLQFLGIHWDAGDPIIYIVITFLSTAILVRYSLQRMELPFSALFHANYHRVSSLLAVTFFPLILLAIGFHVMMSNYFVVYYSFFQPDPGMAESIEGFYSSGFIGILAACIVAPLAEEILFRGIILRGLLSRYTAANAIVFSSILFSLVHMNPEQLLTTLLFGLFAGWLYTRTYSLWPAIAAHILLNASAYALAWPDIQINGVNHYPNDMPVFPSLTTQLIGIACLWGGGYSLWKIMKIGPRRD